MQCKNHEENNEENHQQNHVEDFVDKNHTMINVKIVHQNNIQ